MASNSYDKNNGKNQKNRNASAARVSIMIIGRSNNSHVYLNLNPKPAARLGWQGRDSAEQRFEDDVSGGFEVSRAEGLVNIGLGKRV